MFQTGSQSQPLVVAEIGANHDGSPEKAVKLLQAIAATPCRIVKFQHYTAGELVSDPKRLITYGRGAGQQGEAVGAMFDRLSLGLPALRELFAEARHLGLTPFATPFSEKGVDELVGLGTGAIKIASSDVNHLPLLRHAASTGLPLILSLGKSTLGEAEEAVAEILSNGGESLTLLHCVAAYPAPIPEMNLRAIPMLQAVFPQCRIGFSDHSTGTTAAVVAVALGAKMVEKHVTLNPEDVGPDHWFSLSPMELARLMKEVGDAWQSLGSSGKQITPSEERGRRLGVRSLCAAHDLPPGTVLRGGDLEALRPGGGLPPRYLPVVEGMKLARPLLKGELLTWHHFHQA